MNILIVANFRCGGRYFGDYLAKEYNLNFIHEPQPENIHLYDFKNSCIKLIIYRFTLEEIIRISQQFDYVFLLSRRDKEKHLQSIITLREVTKNMFNKWKWKEEYLNLGYGSNHYSNLIDSNANLFSELSNRLNKKVIYYEDLYYGETPVDLDGLKFKPDLSKKLRLDSNTELI